MVEIDLVILTDAGKDALHPVRPLPHVMTIFGRLFQARMWREYAMAWDGRKTTSGCGRDWVEHILRIPRRECMRRAKVNAYLARRINRASIDRERA